MKHQHLDEISLLVQIENSFLEILTYFWAEAFTLGDRIEGKVMRKCMYASASFERLVLGCVDADLQPDTHFFSIVRDLQDLNTFFPSTL